VKCSWYIQFGTSYLISEPTNKINYYNISEEVLKIDAKNQYLGINFKKNGKHEIICCDSKTMLKNECK